MLKYTHRGILRIGDVEIPCFVLEDGTRVISGRGMTKAIGMKGRGQGMIRVLEHRAINPYLGEELEMAIANPIKFQAGRPVSGYEATILQKLCDAILTAEEQGGLKTEQEQRYAEATYILIRAFAKVGIIALVDEATGYQEQRDRDELHRILEAYISDDLLPWAKRFPDEFYRQMFRLRGWRYSPMSVNRPKLIGKLTAEVVYEKLPPGVLEELRQKNPVVAKGRRRYKHHQFLTEDIGNSHLERHISAVTALMRAAPNWSGFQRLFRRAFPTPNQQGEFVLDNIEE